MRVENISLTTSYKIWDIWRNISGLLNLSFFFIDMLNGPICLNRKTWDKAQMDQSNRNLYINTLYLMSKIVLLRQEINLHTTSDTLQNEYSSNHSSESKFSCQSEASIWRQELETALFDFLLKQSYSEVYDTLLKAVQVCVLLIHSTFVQNTHQIVLGF